MSSSNGILSQGATPEQVMDLTGNVWEWCLGTHSDPQADPALEDLTGSGSRLVRGGSWDDNRGDARAAYRDDDHPANRHFNIGFRVVGGLRPPSLNP